MGPSKHLERHSNKININGNQIHFNQETLMKLSSWNAQSDK